MNAYIKYLNEIIDFLLHVTLDCVVGVIMIFVVSVFDLLFHLLVYEYNNIPVSILTFISDFLGDSHIAILPISFGLIL